VVHKAGEEGTMICLLFTPARMISSCWDSIRR
jgi:hypothetical protein